MEKSTYKNGELDGPFESYYKNGQLAVNSNYKYGNFDGVFEKFSEEGKLQKRKSYKEGKLDGPYESYYTAYDRWNLIIKCNYKDNKLNGPYEKVNEVGNTILKTVFENGTQVGPRESFYRDGGFQGKDDYNKDGIWPGYDYTYDIFQSNIENEKREFLPHLVSFVAVNLSLIILNIITTSFPWAMFPLFGWGIGLVVNFFGIRLFFSAV